jgi:hypothetical protein
MPITAAQARRSLLNSSSESWSGTTYLRIVIPLDPVLRAVFSANHFVIADITTAFVDAPRCFNQCGRASRRKGSVAISMRLRTRPRHTLVGVKRGFCECGGGLRAKCDGAERQHGEDENGAA